MEFPRGVLVRTRLTRAAALLCGVLVVAALISLVLGSGALNVSDVWSDARAREIFLLLRLPRVLMAATVGASLSAVGASLQALFRNPLAEPFTLGVSGGAALGASVALALGIGVGLAGVPAVFLLAFVGATLATWLVYALARTQGTVMPGTLLLSGVVLNLCASAGVLLLQFLTDYTRSLQILRWMIGSLDVVGYGMLWRMALCFVPAWAVLLAQARALNLLAIGEDSAAALGVNVKRVERRVHVACSLIVGVTAAVGGSIGFVGLIVPHIARRLFGQDLRVLLPASFLLGAAFVMIADAVARTVMSPSELPLGVITALLGGPLFLWLLRRERRWGMV